MPNLTLRAIPDDVHANLRSAAQRNHRSLNGEILARLTASVQIDLAERRGLLARIQRNRAEIGPIDTSPETVQELRDRGRA